MSNGAWLPVFQDPSQVFPSIQYQALLTAVACILFYDYLLTLKDEIALIWNSPRSLGKIFFLMIRYGFVVDMALILLYNLQITPTSGPALTAKSCQALYRTAAVIQLVGFASVSAFVAIRIAALWSHSLPLGTILFLLGLLNPSTIIPLSGFKIGMINAPWPMAACIQNVTEENIWFLPLLETDFPIASSAVSIAYEFLCLTLTVSKTFGAYKLQKNTGMRTSFSKLLLRDGSLYFVVLAALGIFNVAASSLPESPLPVDISVILGRTCVPVLTSRFILNLRRTNQPCSSVESFLVDAGNSTLLLDFNSLEAAAAIGLGNLPN
ncbi:hypothetical protein C2E23DRAFT_451706 [Lenzites betulinus]|nr:hypothetical protein C2E23DRAFT_451706 [Lenzites betulinus]